MKKGKYIEPNNSFILRDTSIQRMSLPQLEQLPTFKKKKKSV